MLRSFEMHRKEVVNIRNAERLGFIEDVDIDLETGHILNIIVPHHRFFLFGRNDFIIPWSDIVLVGKDLVLVDYGTDMPEITK